jgi:peptide/nickel transport system ATP-binding protein
MVVNAGEGAGVSSARPLMSVHGLEIDFSTRGEVIHAVRNVDIFIRSASVTGVVGESGSGKSVTAMSLLGLILPPGRLVSGEFEWRGDRCSWPHGLSALRGSGISMVIQDPVAGLNPLVKVGRQITEVLRRRAGFDKAGAEARAVALLQLTGIAAPERHLRSLPGELSGGMAQRVMLAMALAAGPSLLVADEPTSALDVTVQAQILDLLDELRRELDLSVVMVTHDFGVVSRLCEQVYVMYAGRVVESGPVSEVIRRPKHPYTIALLEAVPRFNNGKVEFERTITLKTPPRGSPPEGGCQFAPRCPRATSQCVSVRPVLHDVGSEHMVACWHVDGS